MSKQELVVSNVSNCCSPGPAEMDAATQAIKDFYNAVAEGEGNYSEGTDKFSPSGPTERIKEFVLASDKQRILDIGCGMGTTLLSLVESHKQGKQFIGVDFSEKMIARAREKSTQLPDGFRKKMGFFVADVQSLPYMDGQFDLIYSECVLNLVPDRIKAIQEITRVLAPGGTFIYTDFVSYAPVPSSIKNDLSLVSGCRAGSIQLSENIAQIEEAGYTDLEVINFTDDKNKRYIELMESSQEYKEEYLQFRQDHAEAHHFLEEKVGYYLIKATKA
ncbi:putative arsinothricin biosynthesis methyltransferase ArsM [Paenibacillus sp. P13VS]|uniref:putative arsinothricin biosynthesis methyltransferase ArsM n=1 Tax=Paenibacillus sp. P13VS TaxID=2697367 RepID=UPI00187B4867|nr:putative arsinothricin biosynthesis methyltransferase ArsM [Paenibacillus sp. P13VS]MBE7680096.1 methyltransferase domain-containing protein [Paenibacillus sp. P13VS]